MVDSDRPAFHFTPPANWMNDPNGLVYHNGEYHLFYQYHPGSTVWGPMHWGHAVSHDLVHWQHLPIALHPDEHGMIFSGSAVVDVSNAAGFGANALIAIFTCHKDHVESQHLAYSNDDGRTWTKYAGNPVLPAQDSYRDFRDPKVFWRADHWVMCLAAGRQILFYISKDLKQWERSGTFGDGSGASEGVWETPDLFELSIDNSDEKHWVLTTGVWNGAIAGGSGTQYFIGHFDGRTFTSERSEEAVLWMDHGADFYAPQSWNNEAYGRRLLVGWLSNWQYAKTVPASTWRGAFSLIREVSLTKLTDEVHLLQRPIPEMQRLRAEHFEWREKTIPPNTNLLADLRGDRLEILAAFQWDENVCRFGVRVRVGRAEQTTISYDVNGQKLCVDRSQSGQVDFHERFAAVHSAPLVPLDGLIRLHIFIDASSLEVFANDGRLAFCEAIFPSQQSQGLELFVEGGTIFLHSLDVFYLDPARFQMAENL